MAFGEVAGKNRSYRTDRTYLMVTYPATCLTLASTSGFTPQLPFKDDAVSSPQEVVSLVVLMAAGNLRQKF